MPSFHVRRAQRGASFLGVLAAIIGASMVYSCISSDHAASKAADEKAKVEAALKVQKEAAQHAENERVKTNCTNNIAAIHSSAQEQMAKKDYSSAFELLNPCREYITDNKMKATYKAATDGSIQQTMQATAKAQAELKAKKKREGVLIGMSQQDVLDSMWGKPQRVNRTTTARGVREQWVYGTGNYLYFEDGVLTSIQN